MKMRFAGGAEEVGRLGMVLETQGKRMLFDYGFLPSNPPKFPMAVDGVDLAFITHSHLDHSGMAPMLSRMPKQPRLYGTLPTIDVSSLLIKDSLKIWDAEGVNAPYGKRDANHIAHTWTPIMYERKIYYDDFVVTPHSAGHIPGSAMLEVDTPEGKVMFTGDINTENTRLVEGNYPAKCDVLVMESTYAGRNHEPRAKIEYNFLSKVEEVVDRGGTAIVPVFAVGRTQEMMLLLGKEGYDIWVDGMGKTVNNIYFNHPEYVRNIKHLLKAKRAVNPVRNYRDREPAAKAEVILTTSGMMNGGPVLHYMSKLGKDPKNALLLTGYQVEGTNGRMLVDTGRIDLDGIDFKVEAEVQFYDFSAHAGHDQMVEFARQCKPEKVVLCHGDNRELMANDLENEFEVLMPMNGEEVEF
jgi:putative mRNA 3-end processing factor